MDYITRLGKRYIPRETVIEFLSHLVKDHQAQAGAILEGILAGEDVAPGVLAMMKGYGVNLDILEEINERVQDITKILEMKIKDFDKSHSKSFQLQLLEKGKKGKQPCLDLGAEAALKFEVSTDDDGKLGDKINDFFGSFKTEEICLCLGVEGKIESKVSGSGKGVYDFGGSVKTWGNAKLYNYFIYKDDDSLLESLLEAIPRFKLPGQMSSAGVQLVDNQYLHLHLDDGIELEGKFKCEQAIMEAITFSGGFNTNISVLPTPSVELAFTYKTGGSADLLFYQKEDSDDLFARVILKESNYSSSGINFGVSIGITGLDGIFKGVLKQYFGDINTLVNVVEKQIKAFPKLSALFKDYISGRVDEYLKGAPIKELSTWLKQNLGSPDIQKIIKNALVGAGVQVTQGVFNNMQGQIVAVEKYLIQLIQKYQNVRKRFDNAIKKAAEAKISLSIGHKLEAMNSKQQKYEFQIKRTGTGEIINQMSIGVFTPAIVAAEVGNKVTILSGEKEIKCFRKITNTLNISLLDLEFSQKTLFTQKWDYKVTAAGDITMGVSSRFESNYKDWFKRRNAALLLDTRLLAHTNDKLLRVLSLENSFSYEVVWVEDNPERKKFRKILEEIVKLGMNINIQAILDSLEKDKIKSKPYGNLEIALMMEFAKDDIRSLLCRDEIPREIFAKNRILFTSHNSFKRVANEIIGTEFLLLPSVMEYAMEVRTGSTVLGFGIQIGGKNINFRKEEDVYINQYCLHVEQFEKFISALNSYSSATPDLTSVKHALKSIRVAQNGLLQKGSLFTGEPYLSLVFFRTLFEMVGTENVRPVLLITRKADGKEFRYQ